MRRLLLLRHATRPFASLDALADVAADRAARRLADAEGRLDAEADALVVLLHDAVGTTGAAAPRRNALLALKRDAHNRRVLRSGDLAASGVADRCEAYGRVLAEVAAAEAEWARAFEEGIAHARSALRKAVADPLVAAGLASASGPLAGKLGRLPESAEGRWGHGSRHVAAKAAAYLARFATKTSPNSVFCAVGVAWAEDGAASIEGSPSIARLDVSLSVAEARKIAAVVAGDPDLGAIVRPRPNPTIRESDGGLTFWRFASLRRADDDEALSRVKDHPVLRAVLEEARDAGPNFPVLVAEVARASAIDEASVARFIAQMIERGVLLGEIEIPFTERRPLRFVAEAARAVRPEPAWVRAALAIEDEVDRVSRLAVDDGERAAAMNGIAYALESLPHVRPLRSDEMFRIDAASSLDVRLPSTILDELARGIRPYLRLFAALYPARRYLQGWVDRFLAKFPADRDVSLLDVYHAITEQDDSYRPAAFPEPAGDDPADPSRRALAAVRDLVLERARAAGPVTIDEADLDGLIGPGPSFRWASGVLFQIAARDTHAIASGDYRLVLNGLFHGAGLSLSRFAHLLGEEIVDELRRAWSVIERPGAIVAELTYNHGGRTANAGLRPAIFAHEIELPGDCASPGAKTLALRDLVVRWDSAADRFVLRRTQDGVEVIPVINSGVNPVGFISFVVAIGEQELQPLAYFPGFEAPGVTRWPRIVNGRTVLFRERWTFGPADRPEPSARGDDPLPFARAVVSWRRRHGLPRHVFVHTTKEPKPRYVDLASPPFLDLLRRDLLALGTDAEGRLHVAEMLPGPDALWAGGHASEFLGQMSGRSDG